jgi:hypothetical protein
MNESSGRIYPVQIRGTGASERPGEERGSVPVRIRTRGPLERSLQIRDAVALFDVVKTLRDEVGGLPLTLLIVCDELQGAALEFANELADLTESLDALWIAVAKPPLEVAAIGGSVLILNLADERDRFIASNLVVDFLFMSATEDAATAMLTSLSCRTPFVVVPHDAPELEEFGRAMAGRSIPLVTWNGAAKQIDVPLAGVFWPQTIPPRAGQSEIEWRAVLGERLAAIATQLTLREERRIMFRSILSDVALDGASLIELAEAFRWRRWAVETIPSRYVKRCENEKGAVTALVWQVLLECVASEVVIRKRMCNGAFCEISIAPDDGALLDDLHRTIEERIANLQFGGDPPFFVEVSNAIEQVAVLHPNQKNVARMRNVSKKLGSRRA